MSRKRIGPSSLAKKLIDTGINLPIDSYTINPIGCVNPPKDKYRDIWQYYDLVQCCSRYIWENLPNGLTSDLIERMIYYRGSVAGFKLAGRSYILPYAYKSQGGLNPYGMPVSIQPLTFNGKAEVGKNDIFSENFELPVNNSGDEIETPSAVLLFDNIPTNNFGCVPSRYYLNSIIIDEIVETFARININIIVSNKKIFLIIKDEAQAEIVRKELKSAFSSDSPYAVITSPLDIQNYQSSNDFNADSLFSAIKNYDGLRCSMSGISAKGFGNEKNERLVAGQLAGGEEERDLVLDLGLDLRKHFCEVFNKITGENISVRKRSDEYSEMVDGNNMTEEEREAEL